MIVNCQLILKMNESELLHLSLYSVFRVRQFISSLTGELRLPLYYQMFLLSYSFTLSLGLNYSFTVNSVFVFAPSVAKSRVRSEQRHYMQIQAFFPI